MVPITLNDDVVMSETDEAIILPSQIHITACEVPVSYESVLAMVPPFHARPPVLPESHNPTYPNIPPPEQGFDLCLHVGVAGRGPLRVERLGHKKGYNMKDCGGKLAPIVPVKPVEAERGPAVSDPDPVLTPTPSTPSDAERMEMERLGYDADPFGRLESNDIDGSDIPSRGFPKGYEAFDDEIHTGIDTLKLISFMKETGFEVTFLLALLLHRISLIYSRIFTHPWMLVTTYVTTYIIVPWQKQNVPTETM